MTCKVNADTTNGLKLTSDTSGAIDLQSNGTTRVSMDASGNVGIGDSSPDGLLHVGTGDNLDGTDVDIIIGGNSVNTRQSIIRKKIQSSDRALEFIAASGASDEDIRFYSDATTERMRINSDGRIGVAVDGIGAVQFGMKINGQSWFAVWDDDAGNDKFRVASSGNVHNANNSYGAISDQKLKENIVDTSNKLEDLKRVQVKNYNFIGDSQKQIGVIAQELETVFPSMVEEHADLDEDGNDLGTVTKSVKYSVFVPILIKSLQEQQTIIEDLQTRITALENN
jgi:hypothetical protein